MYLQYPTSKVILADKQITYENIFNRIYKDKEMNNITTSS